MYARENATSECERVKGKGGVWTGCWDPQSIWWHVEARVNFFGPDIFGSCWSKAAGSSGNATSLKWSLDMDEYEGVGRDPLKRLAVRESAW